MQRKIRFFLVVGITTVAIDFSIYQLLIFQSAIQLELAKACSFIIGTIFSYVCNRVFTFQSDNKIITSAAKFIILYVSSLAVNVSVNSLLLAAFGNTEIAFIVATGLSALINFTGMNRYVFGTNARKRRSRCGSR